MNPDYSPKPGYGKRALSFLIDAVICILLMVALYFTVGEYAISRPLGYQTRMDELSALVDESGLADKSGMAYAFPAYALGVAAAEGNFTMLLGFAACCVLPFVIVCALLSRFFSSVLFARSMSSPSLA